ncbi:MAG: hypothetical protein RJB38_115 [Pseudomonadota bacterium]|jgi:hypothetical protein
MKLLDRALAALCMLILPCLAHAHGGHVGDGGQGVYDLRSGKVRFLDILSEEELAQMQLAERPDVEVIKRFQPCTRVTTKSFYTTYGRMSQPVQTIVESLGATLGELLPSFRYASHFNFRHMTALHLNQRRDAKRADPRFQVQLAIYKDGVAFFQEQALALMPEHDLEWLLMKEVFRYVADLKRVKVENALIEEAIYFLHAQDAEGFRSSTYYQQLAPLEDLPLGKTVMERDHSFYAKSVALHDLIANLGHVPAWAIKIGNDPISYGKLKLSDPFYRGDARYTGDFNYFKGFDVETAKPVYDFGRCSD